MTGTELRDIRKSLDMTQGEFAKRLGYTHYSRISQMETGKEPVPDRTANMARILLCNIPEFLRDMLLEATDRNEKIRAKIKQLEG